MVYATIDIMTIIEALILGLVEGLTEFLPISSTAHLLLTGRLLNVSDGNFLATFSIAIQVGAIAAVLFLYRRELISSSTLWRHIMVAFLPTAVIGLLLYPVIKATFLAEMWISIAALFAGGVFLIWFERRISPQLIAADNISYKQAFWIGVAQSVAVIPGVSRAGATIVGGMLAGVSRASIVKFSFLLAVPTMIAAAGLDLVKNFDTLSFSQLKVMAIGLVTSFVVAVAVIKWLTRYVSRHNFSAFGWYRIIIAVVLAAVLL
jgi:undecaprenyl-diphosphatase